MRTQDVHTQSDHSGDKKCVYCAERVATTRDHVIARQFFPDPKPQNLITVPACEVCNGTKRELEEYVCTVFLSHSAAVGGSPSAEILAKEKLVTWLSKRRKLAEHLASRTRHVDVPEQLAARGVRFGFEVDRERVHPLIEMITKGLIYSLHSQYLAEGNGIKVAFDIDDEFLFKFGEPFTKHKSVRGEFGDRVFAYAYLTIAGDPQKSIWTYGFYDVCYGWASVAPNYWTAQARRNARIARRREQRKSRRNSGPPHPGLRR